jgi:hypothetical protein
MLSKRDGIEAAPARHRAPAFLHDRTAIEHRVGRLVEDDRAPAQTLDDDALPAGWGAWITAAAAARARPRDYTAAALVVAASALIGNARRIAATPQPVTRLRCRGQPRKAATPAGAKDHVSIPAAAEVSTLELAR